MLKGKQFFIVCLTVGVVTLASMITISLYKNRDRGVTYELTVGDQRQESLSFSLTDMVPGDSTSYKIGVRGQKAEKYTVTVEFDGEGSLAPFVDVTLTQDGKELHTATLAEWLAGEEATFEADFSQKGTQEITLTYAMGLDVGDEAQNAEADFSVVLSAKEVE